MNKPIDFKRARRKKILLDIIKQAEHLQEVIKPDYELIGRVFINYWDRLSDPTPEDSLDKIVGELLQELEEKLNEPARD